MYGNDVPTISSVSQSSSASCDGRVPSNPIAPVVYGLSSGTLALPSRGLTIGAARSSAARSSASVAPSAPPPARIATLPPALSTSAARPRSSSDGSRAARARTSEVWPATLRLERSLRVASISCTSVGIVTWATPW